MVNLPAPPSVTFASDNAAGVHPAVMDALAGANRGHAIAYGNDEWTARLQDALADLFGQTVVALPVWGGTGANVVSLACLVQASDAVVCTQMSHINVDEGGGPERLTGSKLLDLPAPDGKLTPEQVRSYESWRGDEHHPQPRVVSIAQSTELGTLYSPDEVGALCDEAHRLGMYVHVDGARIANAAAALGGDLPSFTTAAGVDVVSFGGTKNGMMYGEAVVFLRPELATRARFVRKQLTQLPSKARFISAQMLALLDDGLWLDLAGHANTMARRLYDATEGLQGVVFEHPPAVNGLFPILPVGAAGTLQEWCRFYDWEPERRQVRWMTAWDTQPADVDAFAAGVRAVVAEP